MKKIISMVLVLSIVASLIVFSTVVGYADSKDKYKDVFIQYCEEKGYNCTDIDQPYYHCDAKIEYYAQDNTTEVPDLVIIEFGTAFTPMGSAASFGDYVLRCGYYDQYILGHFVYIVGENKIYTIEEAWQSEVEHFADAISQLIKEGNTEFNLIGDMDRDGYLSIIDATYIQQALAKLRDFDTRDSLYDAVYWVSGEVIHYVSDMDRDGDRTIMDATAIQMKLAKLDYPIATPDQA